MESKSTTEVRSSFAECIRHVNETGECIIITDYRVPVAMLCPRPKDPQTTMSPADSD